MKEIAECNYSVYAHISPSNKMYIGITMQNPKKRWRNGTAYKSNKHFTRAINKYKWENFQHEIIAYGLSKKEACNFEKLLIEKLNTTNPNFGYNCSSGGDCGNAFAGKTEEEMNQIRQKMSESRQGFEFSEECRKNISNSKLGEKHHMYGKHHSEEAKKKISNAFLGENHPNYGKSMSEEQKQKISESKIGKYTGENSPHARIVICITTNEIFDCIKHADEKYQIAHGSISMCCLNKRKSCGKHPITGEKLRWMYYEDYKKKGEVA